MSYAEDRVASAKASIAKKEALVLKKKALIEKKEVALIKMGDEQEIRWQKYDIQNLHDDLKRLDQEIVDLKCRALTWQAKADAENSIEIVPAIETFLQEWKSQATEWYIRRIDECKAFLGSDADKALEASHDWYGYQQAIYKRFGTEIMDLVKYHRNDMDAQICKILDADLKAKRKMLVERIGEITGKITDARYLTVDERGEINGVVIGEKGNAEVQTISAGGWNIQCFHFRVLVRKMK